MRCRRMENVTKGDASLTHSVQLTLSWMLQGNAGTISKRYRSVRETTARLVGGLDEVLSIEEERRGSSCRLKLVVTECASGREDLMVYLRIVNQNESWYFEIN
jgi:hypothetical protein